MYKGQVFGTGNEEPPWVELHRAFAVKIEPNDTGPVIGITGEADIFEPCPGKTGTDQIPL
ncbi:MAG: hypothetical protein WBL63_17950 [Candidatus Acidiferrum sp.]